MSIRSSWQVVLFKQSISLLISCLLVLLIVERRQLKHLTLTKFVYFSLKSFQFSLHVLCRNVIKDINIQNCYVLLMNPLSLLNVFFIPGNIFVLKSTLSDIKYKHFGFHLMLLMWYIFPFFNFYSFIYLYLKVSYKQHLVGSFCPS